MRYAILKIQDVEGHQFWRKKTSLYLTNAQWYFEP